MKLPNGKTQQELGLRVLRYGLVLVFLYFGISQLLAPSDWTGWLPVWTESLPIAPETFIILNGAFETVLALALLAGFWTRLVAALLALHMLAITFEIGFTAIGVRDFGITIATAALALLGPDTWTVDARKK